MCLEKSCWLQFDEFREHHTGSLTRIRTYSMFKHWQYNDFNCAPAEHNTCQIQNEFNINYLLFNIGFGRLTEFVWKTYTRNSEISRPLFLAIFLAHSNLETGRQASDNSRNPTKMRTKDSIIIYNIYFIFFSPFSWISLCVRARALVRNAREWYFLFLECELRQLFSICFIGECQFNGKSMAQVNVVGRQVDRQDLSERVICVVSDYNNSDITIIGARYKSNKHFSIANFACVFAKIGTGDSCQPIPYAMLL